MSSSLLFLTLIISLLSFSTSTPTPSPSPIPTATPVSYLSYGDVIPTHTDYLPNYNEQGEWKHYLINNLIVEGEKEQRLYDVKLLYTVNPAVTNQPHIITVHVVRPIDTSTSTSTSRRVEYIQSIDLIGIISGKTYVIPSEQVVMLQKNDMIALSVPNNAIFINVGPNQQGVALPYSSTSVSSTSSSTSRITTFTVVTTGSTSTVLIQICGSFGTVDPQGLPLITWSVQEFWIFPFITDNTIDQEDDVSSITISCRPTDTPLSFDVVVASFVNGQYIFDPTRSVTLTNVISNTQYILPPGKLRVRPGDILGFNSHLSDLRLLLVTPSGFSAPTYYLYQPTYTSSGNKILSSFSPGWQTLFQYTVGPLPTNPPPPTDAPTEPPAINGDPQFSGFQGQSFQFHGLADEYFNLISSPTLQLNAHFVYLSSGRCDYNDTMCFQHPGTYIDVLGFSLPSLATHSTIQIRVQAGTHKQGLRVWITKQNTNTNIGTETETETDLQTELMITPTKMTWVMDTDGNSASIMYDTFGQITITTHMFVIKVMNSENFFNVGFSLLDHHMLRIGHTKHTITEHHICQQQQSQTNIETILRNKYGLENTLHGLVGQTWRNVLVCDRNWVGGVSDYVVSSLFGIDYIHQYYTNTEDHTQSRNHTQHTTHT